MGGNEEFGKGKRGFWEMGIEGKVGGRGRLRKRKQEDGVGEEGGIGNRKAVLGEVGMEKGTIKREVGNEQKEKEEKVGWEPLVKRR